MNDVQRHSMRMEELRGDIALLDEVLRTSTRPAAATGDPDWEQCYRLHQRALRVAISAATLLGRNSELSETLARVEEDQPISSGQLSIICVSLIHQLGQTNRQPRADTLVD
jgi:hypothetical protein